MSAPQEMIVAKLVIKDQRSAVGWDFRLFVVLFVLNEMDLCPSAELQAKHFMCCGASFGGGFVTKAPWQ